MKIWNGFNKNFLKGVDKIENIVYNIYRKKEREVNKMKYTVIINNKVYTTNNRDTVMCLLAENPNATVEVQ